MGEKTHSWSVGGCLCPNMGCLSSSTTPGTWPHTCTQLCINRGLAWPNGLRPQSCRVGHHTTPAPPQPLTWLGVPGPGALRGRQPRTLGVHTLPLPRPVENRIWHSFTYTAQTLLGCGSKISGGRGGPLFHRHDKDKIRQ